MKKSNPYTFFKFIDQSDIPLLLLFGFGLAFLLTGLSSIIQGSLFSCRDEIWTLDAILSGLMSVGISILIGVIAMLYWWLTPRTNPILVPKMKLFSILFLVLSFLSGSIISIEVMLP